MVEICAKAEAIRLGGYEEPSPGQTVAQNAGRKKLVVKQYPKQTTTSRRGEIRLNDYPTTFLVRIYPSAFKAIYPKITTYGWDSPYAKALLMATLIHEFMHGCLGYAPGSGKPVTCIHLAIDYSTAQLLCARVDEIDSAGTGTQDEAREKEGLCDKVEEIRKKWNTPSRASMACDCIRDSPLVDLLARNHDTNGPGGTNDPTDDVDLVKCKVSYPPLSRGMTESCGS